MAQLAIQGHATRGKEVIQLLEMLGGVNTFYKLGTETGLICYLDDKNSICQMQINDYNPCSNYTIFTLEEFEEKFPYKVNDVVINQKYGKGDITQILWIDNEIVYEIHFKNFTAYCKANELRK